MEIPFKVTISRDQLSAQIDRVKTIDPNQQMTEADLENFLQQSNVVFGIDREKLREIAHNPLAVRYPVDIAKGVPPENGKDAYLTIEYEEKEQKVKKKFNFRDVLDIPTVKNGQVIATVMPETEGIDGKAVTGRTIQAKKGKPLRIRAGKNVVQRGNQFVATIDGQVSITNKQITVNPVFEVRGDLDLKTGNVRFIGNIVIHGNVPTGYELIAGGDIKIYGLVEGAFIEAKGNVIVSGGITGGNKGRVRAGGNVQAAYLNQSDVVAEQDIIVQTSIHHSRVQAGGSIICNHGHIIGGNLFSGKDIYVKDLGNRLYTKTQVNIGYNPLLEEREKMIKDELKKISENINKLNTIENKLLEVSKLRGSLSEKEQAIIVKQRLTKQQLTKELNDLNNQLLEIEEEKSQQSEGAVYINGTVYPNTVLRFGKYSKTIQVEHSFVKFYLEEGEIIFQTL